MRIATWNINSLRLRLPLLVKLIAELDPDVICLQETKVPDELFPLDGVKALGFEYVLYAGMKGYNGVAILSRLPMHRLTDAPEWCGKQDSRHIAAAIDAKGGPIELHNFYIPAGGDVPDREVNIKFGHKIDFLAEARGWFAGRKNLSRAVLVGDLNVAPLEHDVWNHKQLLGIVSHTPIETERLLAWQNEGFVDAIRHFVPASEKLYTWWSYRNRDWRLSNRGRRLDHIWATPDLQGKLQRHAILKEARDWPQTSDHVPVLLEMAL